MLSVFPELLFLAPFSALMLRLALALVLGLSAWSHAAQPSTRLRMWAAVEAALVITLVAGSWTQIAALTALVLLGASFFVQGARIFSRSTTALCIVIALSLLVTGPGALAFDLPL